MLSIQAYDSSSDGESADSSTENPAEVIFQAPEPIPAELVKFSSKKDLQICATPTVLPPAIDEDKIHIHPDTKELLYNPKYEELFAPVVGPTNPFKTKQQEIERNMLSGKTFYFIFIYNATKLNQF